MGDIEVIHGDCLVEMPKLPASSIDLILCDLPYGTTACAWDVVIPFEPLWANYRRLLKPGGAVVLTASQPFTSMLVASNLHWFRYEWIWEKAKPVGHLNAKIRPMLAHESILVFSRGDERYTPQGTAPTLAVVSRTNNGAYRDCSGTTVQTVTGYPRSILRFPHDKSTGHPTQKPVDLMEYLIRTYSNPGAVVLDNAVGSGTTPLACINTGRKCIGIEKDRDIYEQAVRRIARPHAPRIRREAEPADLPLFGAAIA